MAKAKTLGRERGDDFHSFSDYVNSLKMHLATGDFRLAASYLASCQFMSDVVSLKLICACAVKIRSLYVWLDKTHP